MDVLHNSLITQFAPSDQAWFLRKAEIVHFKAGDLLGTPEDTAQQVFFLTSGAVALFVRKNASDKARLEVVQLHRRLDAKQAEAFPQVFVRMYKPIGSIPTSTDTSTTTFVGMRYTPGPGFANVIEAEAIGTRITNALQSFVRLE